jgi:hypothetical protein
VAGARLGQACLDRRRFCARSGAVPGPSVGPVGGGVPRIRGDGSGDAGSGRAAQGRLLGSAIGESLSGEGVGSAGPAGGPRRRRSGPCRPPDRGGRLPAAPHRTARCWRGDPVVPPARRPSPDARAGFSNGRRRRPSGAAMTVFAPSGRPPAPPWRRRNHGAGVSAAVAILLGVTAAARSEQTLPCGVSARGGDPSHQFSRVATTGACVEDDGAAPVSRRPSGSAGRAQCREAGRAPGR